MGRGLPGRCQHSHEEPLASHHRSGDGVQGSPLVLDDGPGAEAQPPGYGMCTNVINGGIECNKATDAKVIDRVEFFRRYTGILGVSMPDDSTLYCDQMTSYR